MAGSARPSREEEGSSPPTGRQAGSQTKIGVLALQGAFREHVRILQSLGVEASEVRLPGQLVGLHGLVIPGGESTTMGLLMETYGLMEPLRAFVQARPVFGTCAGLIMLARKTTDGEQPLLGVMDITVRRNAFGRQPRSFEATVELTLGGLARGDGAEVASGLSASESGETTDGIFIRAPWVEEVGTGVEIIARCGAHIVGVRQGHMMGVAFHPELGEDTRLHECFLEMVRASQV